jgi:hypothetical protein
MNREIRRNNMIKFTGQWLLMVMVLLTVFGCSVKSRENSALFGAYADMAASMDTAVLGYNGSGGSGYEPAPVRASGGASYETDGGDDTGIAVPAGRERTRKLIYRAELRIRVQDIEAVEKPVMDSLEKYDAYSASTYINENSRVYSIRVPAASYRPLLAELAGMGKILRRSESAEDVTLKYYDLDARLASKEELLKTFQAYLGKAASIEEIMTVETRIAELQNEIEWTGTELKHLADMVDYATIGLNIDGPANTPLYSKPSLSERIGELFSSFKEFALNALLVLIGFVIFGIPCILALALLFWLLIGKIGLIRRLFAAAAWRKKPVATLADSESSIPEHNGKFTGV